MSSGGPKQQKNIALGVVSSAIFFAPNEPCVDVIRYFNTGVRTARPLEGTRVWSFEGS